MLQVVKDLFGCQKVQSRYAFCHIAFHGESFSRPGLSIGKAGDFGSLESTVNKWPDGLVIDLLVI